MNVESPFSAIPSVDSLLHAPSLTVFNQKLARPVRVRLIQRQLSQLRSQLKRGQGLTSAEDLLESLKKSYESLLIPSIKRVINATGVMLHTNLGRAPLGRDALAEMVDALSGYCSLEFDVKLGERGSRSARIEDLLSLITGAEAAAVVNNNAAAILVTLFALARGKEVLVSRGEMVQIGGGFRIPEVLEASGAGLREVGTTNITEFCDYERAIGPETAAILKVHQSNFVITGHSKSVSVKELARLAKEKDLPLILDLGSGLLESNSLDIDEETVDHALGEGCSVVCFSGDKLLGGPQAGLIVGDEGIIRAVKTSPLYRALRLSKTDLFLIDRCLRVVLQGGKTPLKRLFSVPLEEIENRSKDISRDLSHWGAELSPSLSSIGGGACPGEGLPSFRIEIPTSDVNKLSRSLLAHPVPVVVLREKNKIAIDLRTVFAEEDQELLSTLRRGLSCLF